MKETELFSVREGFPVNQVTSRAPGAVPEGVGTPDPVENATGPWDSGVFPQKSCVPGQGGPEGDGDRVTVDLVGVRLRVDRELLHDVSLSMAEGEVPDSILFTSQRGISVSVAVLAEPVDAHRWETGLAEDTAAALRTDAATGTGEGAEVSLIRSDTGTEILGRDGSGHLRMLKLGADGPRWTLLVSCFGREVTDSDTAVARDLMTSAVVFRGTRPMPPDRPLSMQLTSGGGS